MAVAATGRYRQLERVAGGAAATADAAGAAAAGTAATKADSNNDPMGYFVDSLFRKDVTPAGTGTAAAGGAVASKRAAGETPEADTAGSSAEVSRIFMQNIRSGPLPPQDLRYVSQVVAERTGVSQSEAERRVNESYSSMQAKLQDTEVKAKEVADKSRKASATAALWLFVSLLIGAFFASWAAVYGGRHRDIA